MRSSVFKVILVFTYISILSGCAFVDWLASDENEDSDIDPAVRTVAKILSGMSEDPKIIEKIPLDFILPKYEKIEALFLKSGKEIISDSRGCDYLYDHKRISGMTNFYNKYFSYELKEIDSILILNSDDEELTWILPDDFHDNYAQKNIELIRSLYLHNDEHIFFNDENGKTDWYTNAVVGVDAKGEEVRMPFDDIFMFTAIASDNLVEILQARDMWDYENADIWEYEEE